MTLTPRSISFRSALVVTVLAILLATVGVVGVFSYLNARFIVGDLSSHVLDQTAERIHDRIRNLLDRAALISDVQQRYLEGRHLTSKDFPPIVRQFYDSLVLSGNLTYISLGLETGAYCHAYRKPDGSIQLRMREIQADGRTLQNNYVVDGDALKLVESTYDDYDPRVRPYYVQAKRLGRQTWPKVYLFKNQPNPDYPGLTCATPIYAADGSFQGVLTADFDLIALGKYLAGLGIFQHGEAFVVEVAADGSRRVIAHPDPDVLTGPVLIDGEVKTDILPLSKIASAPVRALMSQVPAGPLDATAGLSKLDFQADGIDYVGAWEPLHSRHDVHWLIGITVPRSDLMSPVERSNLQTLLIGVVSLVLATVLAVYLARRISKPLRLLAAETEAIGRFHLDPKRHEPTRLAELSRLNGAVEEMKAGLRSFQKFVPAELVRTVLSTGHEIALGGERRILTVCFTDIAGFTPMAERLTPEQMVGVLGRYFEAVSQEIEGTGGTVDKYMGDGVMAFWGAPLPKPSHALDACMSALGIRARIERLSADLVGEGLPPLAVRVGLATGELIVGNIGSRSRLSYTVIGDPVNLASRLEELNKRYRTGVLVAEQTLEEAGEAVVARPIERVAVKGKLRGTLVYELLARRDQADRATLDLAARAAEALARYHRRDFEGAAGLYREILATWPRDHASEVLLRRCEEYAATPPGPDWQGVHAMRRK